MGRYELERTGRRTERGKKKKEKEKKQKKPV